MACLQVYLAVQDIPGIVHAKESPRVRDGTYVVDLAPLGYHRQPKNEAEMRAAVKVVLGALKELHGRGYVHHDIRWENIMHSDEVSGNG
jgi:hypothetical protein